MANGITINARGPLFAGNAGQKAKNAVREAAINKVTERIQRTPRRAGLGIQRNTLTENERGQLDVEVVSTKVWPRTVGTSWTNKNMAAARAMLPRVIRATAKKIAEDLGGD